MIKIWRWYSKLPLKQQKLIKAFSWPYTGLISLCKEIGPFMLATVLCAGGVIIGILIGHFVAPLLGWSIGILYYYLLISAALFFND
jgi:hypothetical protein